MILAFISIRFFDIVDILLVAFLMYQVYSLIRGTVAFNIFIGIIGIYLIYTIVNMLKMKLLSSILGAVIGGGAIALIIVFQQEIRGFLIYIGSRYFQNRNFNLEKLFGTTSVNKTYSLSLESVYKASQKLSASHTGALIIISRGSSLNLYAETGDILNARISSRLIESIFVKNSPLHDGAIIIENNKILAARCVLPFTNKTNLPPHLGMRHRAGLGISESTDAFVIIVSEERGEISIAENGYLIPNLSHSEFKNLLKKRFGSNAK